MTISLAYLAFKALRRDDEGRLISPARGSNWTYDIMGRPCLIAPEGDIERGHGIFAASWHEAVGYGNEIYLVSPSIDQADGDDVVIATGGWRSRYATVVGGPWRADDPDAMYQASGIVISTWEQGYPQVREILAWAGYTAHNSEALIATGDPEWLYLATRDLPDGRYDPRLLEALIASGNPGWLHLAAVDLPDDRYDPRLVEALSATGDVWRLYRAAVNLPDDRYDPRLLEALIASGDPEYLYRTVRNLPDSRRDPRLLEALIASGDAWKLYRAAAQLRPQPAG